MIESALNFAFEGLAPKPCQGHVRLLPSIFSPAQTSFRDLFEIVGMVGIPLEAGTQLNVSCGRGQITAN